MTEGERGIKYFILRNGSRRILLPSSAISASGNISASQARLTPPSRREALLARSHARENYRQRVTFADGLFVGDGAPTSRYEILKQDLI